MLHAWIGLLLISNLKMTSTTTPPIRLANSTSTNYIKRVNRSIYSAFGLVNFCFLWSQNGSFGWNVKTK